MPEGIEERFRQFSEQPQQEQAPSDIESRFAQFQQSPQMQQPDVRTGSFGQVLPSIESGMTSGVSQEEEAVSGIKGPLLETMRGFYQGTESLFNKLDAATKLIEKTTGLERGGLFGDIAEQQRIAQQVIPETDLGDISKTVFSMIGSTPTVIAEFEAIPTGKLKGIPSFAAKTGILEALDEFNKDETAAALVQGLATGATTGALFAGGAKVFGRGIDLLKKFGKRTAETWIKLTTGDPKLAKQFVNNPNKFNVNPLGKTKAKEDIIKEFHDKSINLKNEYARKLSDFKENQFIKKESIRIASQDAKNAIRDAQANARAALEEKSKISIDKVIENSNDAISKNNAILKDKALNLFEETAGKLKIIKDTAGKQVGLAIQETVESNPGALVKGSNVLPKIQKVVKETSPFRIERGKAVPRTAVSGDQTDINVFNNLLNEVRGMAKEGFPPQYLQDLKVATRDLAGKAFRDGNNKLGQMYNEISSVVNPANIVQTNPVLAKSFSKIAEANKKFSAIIPRYEEAMKHYFVKDAQGNFVPDYTKAMNAIRNNNKPVLRQMQKADSFLPKEDRILPKLTDLIRTTEKANSDSKALVSLTKRKAQQHKKALLKANKEAIAKMNKEQGKISFERLQGLRKELRTFRETEQKNLDMIIGKLEEQEQFLLGEVALSQFVTQGKGFIPTAQRASIFSLIGGAQFGRPEIAIPSAINVTALAPRTAALTTKPFLTGGAKVADKAKQAVQNETLRKLLATTALRQDQESR